MAAIAIIALYWHHKPFDCATRISYTARGKPSAAARRHGANDPVTLGTARHRPSTSGVGPVFRLFARLGWPFQVDLQITFRRRPCSDRPKTPLNTGYQCSPSPPPWSGAAASSSATSPMRPSSRTPPGRTAAAATSSSCGGEVKMPLMRRNPKPAKTTPITSNG